MYYLPDKIVEVGFEVDKEEGIVRVERPFFDFDKQDFVDDGKKGYLPVKWNGAPSGRMHWFCIEDEWIVLVSVDPTLPFLTMELYHYFGTDLCGSIHLQEHQCYVECEWFDEIKRDPLEVLKEFWTMLCESRAY